MIGSVLGGRYELTSALADGPLFTTYSARDRVQGRDVCVRVIKEPFSREPAFVTALSAVVKKTFGSPIPHAESIYGVESQGPTSYMVGELTRGPHLEDRIRKLAPFSVPLAVAIGIAVAQSLEAVHRRNLVAGDVGSHNFALLGDTDVRLQLVGIWEAYGHSPSAGAVVLPQMAPYMAPEVSNNEMPSQRSDVYGIGIILFELLTGRQPYHGDTPIQQVVAHQRAELPGVREINPSVPVALEELIKKAMAKDPSERYAHAGELLSDLRLVHDALRFGKTLTWPLRGGTPVSGAVRTRKTTESPRVTPTMSAIRTPEEADAHARKRRSERDVPVWMLILMAMLGTAVLSLVGFWVMFNVNKPRLVPVPNLKGMSVEEARGLLSESKLSLQISARESNERVPVDHILDVTPEAGLQVRQGGTVSVVISAGSRFVSVPDLKGLTVDKATSVLEKLNLSLKTPTPTVRSDEPAGTIVRQVPAPRVTVERGRGIEVAISGGAELSEPPPDLNATYVYNLKLRMPELDAPVQVKIELVDEDSPDGRIVFMEERGSRDEVSLETKSKDRRIRFVVYYDDQEVQTVEKEATP